MNLVGYQLFCQLIWVAVTRGQDWGQAEETKAEGVVDWGQPQLEEAKAIAIGLPQQNLVVVPAPPNPPPGCTCVAASLCDPAGVNTFGEGSIDPRALCVAGSVCCSLLLTSTTTTTKATTTTTTTPATAAPLSGCGQVNPLGVTLTSTRIVSVNSTATTLFGEFPWMVAILEKTDTGSRYVCGGSLLQASVVLTAAHCVQNKVASNLIVRLGEWDVATTTEPYPFQEISVSSSLLHPNYYPDALFNDVALLGLSAPADLTRPNIGLSCLPTLPTATATYNLSNCVTIGWGKNAFNSPGLSTVLKMTTIPIVGDTDCQASLQATRLGPTFRLHDSFVCAGKAGSDACTGDGGGPLMCPLAQQPNKMPQVGVVSWGIGCGGPAPGVYADLTQLGTWVQANMPLVTAG